MARRQRQQAAANPSAGSCLSDRADLTIAQGRALVRAIEALETIEPSACLGAPNDSEHWPRGGAAVWNDSGDAVYLYDAAGNLVTAYAY